MFSFWRNFGGNVQVLPPVNQVGGRKRAVVANIALAAQAAGSQIMIARLPLFAAVTAINVITDTSLGSATLQIGDSNTANLYAAAATYTSVNSPYDVGLAATLGAPITTGYDVQAGLDNYANPGPGGAEYEDVILTTAAAALPASGNLVVILEYMLD
jgi:hypothetical protein